MTTLRISAVVVALALCLASAASPKPHTITKTTTVTASYDDTWSAVADVAAARKWTIVTNDKPTGTLVTDWMPDEMSHADCGADAVGKDRDPKVRLNVRVARNGAATTVTIDAAFQRIRMFDNAGRQIDCSSKGTLESRLFTEIRTRTKLAAIEKEKQTAEADSAPFYCTATWCARAEAECESRRAELVKTHGNAPACAKTEKAVCFIGTNTEGVQTESCHFTAEACNAHRKTVTTPPAQITDPGECS